MYVCICNSSTSAQSPKSIVIEDYNLKLCLSDRFESVKLLNEDNKNEEKIGIFITLNF